MPVHVHVPETAALLPEWKPNRAHTQHSKHWPRGQTSDAVLPGSQPTWPANSPHGVRSLHLPRAYNYKPDWLWMCDTHSYTHFTHTENQENNAR